MDRIVGTPGNQVSDTTSRELEEVLLAASAAQRVFGVSDVRQRASFLEAIAVALEQDLPGLVDTAQRETALGHARLEYEVRRSSEQFRLMARVIQDGMWLGCVIDHAHETPLGPSQDLRVMNRPLGPVLVFGAANFPLASSVPGSDTASALAAGCVVVAKVHPGHPETCARSAQLIQNAAQRSGFPSEVLSIIAGLDAGREAATSPHIAAIGFTGSRHGGKLLGDLCAQREAPIPFFGELGAVNPVVITEAALKDRGAEIANAFVANVTRGSGQFCTKPGLCFIPNSELGNCFIRDVGNEVAKLGSLPLLNTHIAENFDAGKSRLEQLIVNSNGSIMKHGEAIIGVVALEAAMQASTTPLFEEYFGPSSLLITYDDLEQIWPLVTSLDGSLAFSIFVQPEEGDAAHLLSLATSKAGRVLVNEFGPGTSVSWSMHHGGPFPSASDPRTSSMGASSIQRWLRPVAFQNVPDHLLPPELQEANPLSIPRRVDEVLQQP